MTHALWIVSLIGTVGGCVDYEVQQTIEIEGFQLDEGSEPVDILWVVDASGSMYEEQTALAEGAQRFMEILTLVALPFELNMVSMDLEQDQAGEVLGDTLHQDSEDLVAEDT